MTVDTGANHSGDRVKRSTVKSSTMKGPIEYVREGLPVRFCEKPVGGIRLLQSVAAVMSGGNWGDGAKL